MVVSQGKADTSNLPDSIDVSKLMVYCKHVWRPPSPEKQKQLTPESTLKGNLWTCTWQDFANSITVSKKKKAPPPRRQQIVQNWVPLKESILKDSCPYADFWMRLYYIKCCLSRQTYSKWVPMAAGNVQRSECNLLQSKCVSFLRAKLKCKPGSWKG